MSKVKNISGGPVDTPLMNRQIETDEVFEAPDYQPGHGPGHCEQCEPGREMTYVWAGKFEPVTETTVSDEPEGAAE